MTTKKYGDLIARAKRGVHYWTRVAMRDFTEGLLARMTKRDMNNAALATAADVSPAYITKVLRGSENFTLETMSKLALAVGCHVRVQLASNAREEILINTPTGNTVTRVENGAAPHIRLVASQGTIVPAKAVWPMAEHVFTVICRRAIVDEATKIPSLIDIIDGFEYLGGPEDIDAQPAFPLELAVVTQWARSDPNTPEMTRHRLSILGPKPPKEPPQSLPEAAVDLTAGRFHRTTFAMQGFPNYGVGDYSLLIELLVREEWIVAKRLTFTIRRKAIP